VEKTWQKPKDLLGVRGCARATPPPSHLS